MANNIPSQGDINIRYFFKGKGAFDAKLAVQTLSELQTLINDFAGYYSDGDLVWVSTERKFHIIAVDQGTGAVTYSVYDTGSGGSITPIADSGFMYYGGENHVYEYNTNGNQLHKPSAVGYKDGELIVASTDIPLGGITRLDAFAVVINGPTEGYNPIGTLKGDPGSQGPKGDKGDKGEAFTVNSQGTIANRPACDAVGAGLPNGQDGYSYLATDEGMIYFVVVDQLTGTCSWSTGAPFGKGDPGESTYYVFKRSTSPLIGGDQPTPGLPQDQVDKGWTDSPTPDDPNIINDLLYMSTATYGVDTNGVPVQPIDWSIPVPLQGVNGLDGQEGADAGFWVVWSEEHDMPSVPTNKPFKDGNGNDQWTPDAGQSWFDDIGTLPSNDNPRWMAQCNYLNASDTWGSWVISQIGGEEPPYKINIFARQAAKPADIVTGIQYKQNDGSFTSGYEAANLVNADVGSVVWFDAPPAEDPNDSTKKLWFAEIIVYQNQVNTAWSVPVQLDGAEGDEAGIWSVWTDNNATDEAGLPPLQTADDIIDNVNDTIDLTGSPGWVDTSTVNSVWMATTYFRKGHWSAWKKMKVKGEKGDPGASFTIDAQGPGGSDMDQYCSEPKGFSYLDTSTSLLHFKTTDAGVTPCTWSAGAPFGKGSNGESYYNLFAKGTTAVPPTEPAPNTKKEDAIGTIWKDAPPALSQGERLFMTTTSYVLDDSGTPENPFTWSPVVTIDGEEGVSAGIWSIWSTYDTPIDPPAVSTIISPDGSSLNLSGTQWIDDTTSTTLDIIWMATSYYRPATTQEITNGDADSKGWLWTTWVIAKVKGEDGTKGDQGDPAYTYVPNTMFVALDKSIDLSSQTAQGGCLAGNSTSGYVVDVSGGITVGGTPYNFQDGIPVTTNEERVWMIQGVFNSNDHLCGAATLNWGHPTVLRDTAGMDYKYHRGDGNPSPGQAGTKPDDPDTDPTGWVEDPDTITDGAFWLAQRNWSEGPSAQWKVYQIRGEDGAAGNINVYYSDWFNYNPNGPLVEFSENDVQNMLGNPDNKPAVWSPGREVDNHVYADICASKTNSFFVAERSSTVTPPTIPADPDRGLYDPFINGDWVISRIDVTALPTRNTIAYNSSAIVKSQGTELDRSHSYTAGVVRLSRPGDIVRITGSGLDAVINVANNDHIKCIGFPSGYIINWVNSDNSDEPLYISCTMSKTGYSTQNDACNDSMAMTKTMMFSGYGQIPQNGDLVLEVTENPINIDPAKLWYIVWSYSQNTSTHSGVVVKMNTDGTVDGYSYPCP